MQKNYIILAHKNPYQIKHLINKLNDDSSNIYIHIDSNADIKPFKNALSNLPNTKFINNRENGTWGDFGIVQATINSLKEIVEHQKEGYFILLSGQDYPIKSKEKINSFLSENNFYDFIEVSPIEEVFPTEWNLRLNYYKYNLSNDKGKYILFPSKLNKSFFSLNLLKNIIKIITHKRKISFIKEIITNFNREREIPNNITSYAGGQWWALTYNTVEKILNFINHNPEFINYHKHSLLPDEVFFQTIIKHLSTNDYNIKIHDAITYINWSRKNCTLPVTFNTQDFEELIYQPKHKLFARKFDFDYDSKIINQLDGI